MGNVTVKQFEESVENGFRNFLKYEGDAVLHYCAYHYLCDRQFAYHITDISKGAMKVKMADCDREARYASWMPILKREIEELGEPIMIAIGNKASEALMHAGFQTAGRVRHFATRLDDWYRGYYLSYVRHTTQDLVSPFLDRWPGFVDKLMLQLPQHCLNISYLDKLRLSVSDAGRGRFLYYMDEFSQMIVGSVVNADKIGG